MSSGGPGGGPGPGGESVSASESASASASASGSSSSVCNCCGCNGCCVPVVADPAPYDVVLDEIPWEITAPACVAIDGATGQFVPVDPTDPPGGACGYCGQYCNVSTGVVLPGTFKTDLGGLCVTSPCSLPPLCLILECQREIPTRLLPECCGRLRLWIGLTVSGGSLSGDDGSRPEFVDCGETCTSWVKLAPSSCSCEGGVLSAEFNLEGIEIVCEEYWVGGVCDGQPKCCTVSCNLAGAYLVI